MKTFSNIWSIPRYKISTLVFIFLLINIAGICIPNMVHLIGGQPIGRLLLPMHYIIIITGLLFGWEIGLLSGLSIPLFSFFISGMPPVSILPFMMIETCIYGFCSGIFYKKFQSHLYLSLFLTLLLGRLSAFSFYIALGQTVHPIINNIIHGWLGIIIQIITIPLFIKWIEKIINKRTYNK